MSTRRARRRMTAAECAVCARTLAVAGALDDAAHEHLDRTDVLERHLALGSRGRDGRRGWVRAPLNMQRGTHTEAQEHRARLAASRAERGRLPSRAGRRLPDLPPDLRSGQRRTLPVVRWCSPSAERSSSSEAARPMSILLPKIRKGTVPRSSAESSDCARESGERRSAGAGTGAVSARGRGRGARGAGRGRRRQPPTPRSIQSARHSRRAPSSTRRSGRAQSRRRGRRSRRPAGSNPSTRAALRKRAGAGAGAESEWPHAAGTKGRRRGVHAEPAARGWNAVVLGQEAGEPPRPGLLARGGAPREEPCGAEERAHQSRGRRGQMCGI